MFCQICNIPLFAVKVVLQEEKHLVTKAANIREHVLSHSPSHAGTNVPLHLQLRRSACKLTRPERLAHQWEQWYCQDKQMEEMLQLGSQLQITP